MAKVHVKKGDTVVVLSGKDKDKKGKVLTVNPSKSTVLVEKVNLQVKHRKPKNAQQPGEITEIEGFIHSSNVMLICNKCGEKTRVGKHLLEDGSKARVCKKCNEQIDMVLEKNK